MENEINHINNSNNNKLNIDDIATRLEVLDRIIRLGWSLLAASFFIGVWVTTLELRAQNLNKVDMELMSHVKTEETAIENLQIWKASTDANRYTSQQANTSFNVINESINAEDKRIQRLEDYYQNILKSLDRMETKLEFVKLPSSPSK
jgi:hypothetical protein